jgi:hypothetical protein
VNQHTAGRLFCPMSAAYQAIDAAQNIQVHDTPSQRRETTSSIIKRYRCITEKRYQHWIRKHRCIARYSEGGICLTPLGDETSARGTVSGPANFQLRIAPQRKLAALQVGKPRSLNMCGTRTLRAARTNPKTRAQHSRDRTSFTHAYREDAAAVHVFRASFHQNSRIRDRDAQHRDPDPLMGYPLRRSATSALSLAACGW